jgi:hypothetical protein
MSLVESSRDSTQATRPSVIACVLVASIAGLAVGALTAYAQGWLGDSVGSLANSAGSWSVVAFLVARYARRIPVAVAAAMVALAACELGYAMATELRGGSNATSTVVFWLMAAVLAGPPLGVAGGWSTGTGLRRSVGFAVIGGVLIGEGLYGWTTVADTTDWRYWATELILGFALVALVVATGRQVRHALATVVTSALVAGVVFGAARIV